MGQKLIQSTKVSATGKQTNQVNISIDYYQGECDADHLLFPVLDFVIIK